MAQSPFRQSVGYYYIIENFERGTSIQFQFLHCRNISRNGSCTCTEMTTPLLLLVPEEHDFCKHVLNWGEIWQLLRLFRRAHSTLQLLACPGWRSYTVPQAIHCRAFETDRVPYKTVATAGWPGRFLQFLFSEFCFWIILFSKNHHHILHADGDHDLNVAREECPPPLFGFGMRGQ